MGLFDFLKKSEKPETTTFDDDGDVSRENMIEGVGELDDLMVKDVMVPRIDVSFVSDDTTQEEFFETVRENGFSRYPVYHETIDNVVGILYVKDIIKNADAPFDIQKLMRSAYFIPDSKHLRNLLYEFKKRKVHIGIAIDEYGGVSGIVSLEDILEVIVGDIQDEFDEDLTQEMVRQNDGSWIIEARTSIEDVNEEIGASFNEDDFETLGGYVFELFGRIPRQGESISDGTWTFTIRDIDGHKINSVLVVQNAEEKKLD